MLFQNKLQVSCSQVLQSFWSALMTTKFWKNPKKKKTISDWSIKTCPSYESYFANQKNCEDIYLILTVHLSNLRVEMMRKKVYFDIKLRNHATVAFCSKISIFIFFLESHSISFLKMATESFKFTNSCAVRQKKKNNNNSLHPSNLRRHD